MGKRVLAVSYAARGHAVFPLHWILPDGRCSCSAPACTSPGKHPKLAGGFQAASLDPKIIEGWWDRWPDANIGTPTGVSAGFVVLDIDPRHGGDETLVDLEHEHGKLPSTVEVVTGGGGRHLYFEHPGVMVRNSTGKVGPGIDIRGDGGYVLLPGSITSRAYEWEASSHPDDISLALMPAWLLALCTEKPSSASYHADALPDVIPMGERNATLTSLAGSMRRRGSSEAAILAALEVENERCEQPLSDRELRAISQSVARYQPSIPERNGSAPEAPSNEVGPVLARLSEVKPEHVRWLWPARIPLGKLTLLDGDPGLGKSTMTLDLAARVSRALPMPDGTRGDLGGPAGVVILTAEDGLGDTVRPRLEAAGADLDRIQALTAIWEASADTSRPATLADLGPLETAIGKAGAAMVIVDPLMAYMPDNVRTFSDHHIRRALAPLADLGERTGVAIVVIRHLNKTVGSNPLYRGGGSIGIIGGARSALLVASDPDDPDGRRRVLASIKSNLAATPPALAFHVEPLEPGGDVVRIVWDGATEHTARTLLAASSDDDGERSELDSAKAFLAEALGEGPLPGERVKVEARDAAISERTLWRAKKALNVEAHKDGFNGPWLWWLPSDSSKAANGHPSVPAKNDGSLGKSLAAFGQKLFGGELVEEPGASQSGPEPLDEIPF